MLFTWHNITMNNEIVGENGETTENGENGDGVEVVEDDEDVAEVKDGKRSAPVEITEGKHNFFPLDVRFFVLHIPYPPLSLFLFLGNL